MGDKLLKNYFSAIQKTKLLLILFVCLLYIILYENGGNFFFK